MKPPLNVMSGWQETEGNVDDVEFLRAYNNLRTLIGHSTDPDIGPVNVRNALLIIAAMLDALNQRFAELQEEDEE